MPYLTRADGERFIIPSYREILTARKGSQLKKEILLLAENYGHYITLQKKGPEQYEVAFSPDPGPLLGETIWYRFKRPRDMIYCEAIPNTNEAILIIVKSGSVYLDGSFPIDSIPEELVIFLTQENQFEIYVYGDVPIAQKPETGKFAFESSSVKSFEALNNPVFPSLPIIKTYQLQPVEVVLQAQGIGVFPIKKIIATILIVGIIWILYIFVTTQKPIITQTFVNVINPYQGYIQALSTPDPAKQIENLSNAIAKIYTIPGWLPSSMVYEKGLLKVLMVSMGARTHILFDWARWNYVTVSVDTNGFSLNYPIATYNRLPPTNIYSLEDVIGNLIDRLSYVLPGNIMSIKATQNNIKYIEEELTINFDSISTSTLNLIGQQFEQLPLILVKANFSFTNGYLSGTIVLKALGN